MVASFCSFSSKAPARKWSDALWKSVFVFWLAYVLPHSPVRVHIYTYIRTHTQALMNRIRESKACRCAHWEDSDTNMHTTATFYLEHVSCLFCHLHSALQAVKERTRKKKKWCLQGGFISKNSCNHFRLTLPTEKLAASLGLYMANLSKMP